MPNAVVLVIDRLGSGFLGPYGNTWLETPAWNRLAARSVLFETCQVDSPDLSISYRSYWHGCHALAPSSFDSVPLPAALSNQGIDTWLITDERLVAEQSAAQGFGHRVVLPPGYEQETESIEDTQLARVFATAIDALQQARPPFLVWIHAQAMQGPWDAPYALRAQFAEDEDPEPPSLVAPPECHLKSDYDPDLLLGFQHAYAGQVTVLDTCLGVLLDTLWSSSLADSTALLTTASRAFPLGDHRYVGRAELPLFGDLIQVPCITCWPQSAGALWRVQQIVQPPDFCPTLQRWFALPPAPEPAWGRDLAPTGLNDIGTGGGSFDLACSALAQQRAVRVPAWFLHQDPPATPQLFVKPDDRWEFNEISDRCRAVVDELADVMGQFEQAAAANDRTQLPALSELLRSGLA